MPKGKAIPYSAEEMTWLEANRAMVISDYAAAFADEFGRVIDPKNLHALRKRKGWKTGRTGQFVAGSASWNKGRACEEGRGGRHPNARKTQFRAGVRQGVAVKLYKPIGTERMMDGYLQRKINDDMPAHKRWRAVHLINWEAVNGSLPDGHCLKCIDGNRLNTEVSNWILVSRGLLSRLNGGRWQRRLKFDDAHPEVKPAVLALAQVEQARFEMRKDDADA